MEIQVRHFAVCLPTDKRYRRRDDYPPRPRSTIAAAGSEVVRLIAPAPGGPANRRA